LTAALNVDRLNLIQSQAAKALDLGVPIVRVLHLCMSRLVGWLSLGRSVFFPVKPVLGIPVSLLVVPPSAFCLWILRLLGDASNRF